MSTGFGFLSFFVGGKPSRVRLETPAEQPPPARSGERPPGHHREVETVQSWVPPLPFYNTETLSGVFQA